MEGAYKERPWNAPCYNSCATRRHRRTSVGKIANQTNISKMSWLLNEIDDQVDYLWADQIWSIWKKKQKRKLEITFAGRL